MTDSEGTAMDDPILSAGITRAYERPAGMVEIHDEHGNFLGFEDRECGDHRTVGPHRALCHDCSEWCYPSIPCLRCERTALVRDLAALRAEVVQLRTDCERLDEALVVALEDAERLRVGCQTLADAVLTNIDTVHPLQYGFRDGHAVIGYDPDDETVVERFDRCPSCEEWSPCAVRRAALPGDQEKTE